MRLNKETEYALRLLIHIYAVRSDLVVDPMAKITLQELATAVDVSRAQLGKITGLLVGKGYLASTTGRSGGLSVKLAAEDISVGEIVELFESAPKEVDFGASFSPVTAGSTLSAVILGAQIVFIDHLKETTIADIISAL